jgi:hypothetical protein
MHVDFDVGELGVGGDLVGKAANGGGHSDGDGPRGSPPTPRNEPRTGGICWQS